MVDITIRELLEAGVHYGHKSRYWSPNMSPYLYGTRDNVHIINLEKTLPLFQQALQLVEEAARRKAKVLFVGTKRAASKHVREAAINSKMPYIDYRWSGGLLTNYKTIRQSIKRLKELEQMSQDGTFDKLTKKEVLMLKRQMEKLSRSLGGIKDMAGLPDLLFIIDVGHEHIAVSEARRLGIPIIGIVDSNNSPEGIDYVIPGNDDGMRAIKLYTEKFTQAIQNGREKQPNKVAEEAAASAE